MIAGLLITVLVLTICKIINALTRHGARLASSRKFNNRG